MRMIDPEMCQRCTHERKYHGENNCTVDGCNCHGFSKLRVNLEAARSKAQESLREAALALEPACETRKQLANEMREAVERFIREEIPAEEKKSQPLKL